jgi:hypothetical protein
MGLVSWSFCPWQTFPAYWADALDMKKLKCCEYGPRGRYDGTNRLVIHNFNKKISPVAVALWQNMRLIILRSRVQNLPLAPGKSRYHKD